MADEVVIARFRSDLDQVKKDFEDYIKGLDRIQDKEKETAKVSDVTTRKEETSSKKRLVLLKQEEKELSRLTLERKKAFNVKEIEDYNKKIAESKTRISTLQGQTTSFGNSTKGIFNNLAIGIASAFSITAISAFAKASINAFLEAEQNANKLRFAVTEIGGEGEAAFQRLIDQSVKLQKTSIFSDDQIQQAQTILSTFGLTSNQIEELTPKLADFASATKRDITSAAEAIGAGLQGAGKEFKKFNINVDATKTELENYNEILRGLSGSAGAAAADLESLTGQLKQQANQADDLQEIVGEKLAPAWIGLKTAIFEGILGLIGFNKELEKIKAENTEVISDALTLSVDRVRKAGGDVFAELEKARVKAIETNKAQIAELDRLIVKYEEFKKALGGTPASGQVLSNLNEEIQRQKELVDLQKEKIKQIEFTISREEVARDEIEKTLTAEQLRLKTTAELNFLLKKNGEENDIISQSNVKLINKELEARKKLEAQNKKALDAAKDLREVTDDTINSLEKLASPELTPLETIFVESKKGVQSFRDAVKDASEDLNKLAQEEFVVSLTLQNKARVEANQPPVSGEAEGLTPEEIKERTISTTTSLLSELSSLYNAYTDQQIDRINRERDAKLAQLDIEEDAITKQLERRGLTEKEAEAKREELLRQRVKAEETAARKEREIRRKQAILDRAAALIQITINTAEAISKALTAGPAGVALAALYGALGAAQAAVVVAQPIPYKKGSKNTRAGFSVVGEEAPEFMMMPQGAKVVPGRQTAKYRDAVDAMIDDDFYGWIDREFMAPKLREMQKNHDRELQTAFANNIVNSITVGSKTSGMDQYGMMSQFKRLKDTPQKLDDETIYKLGEVISSNRPNPFRR